MQLIDACILACVRDYNVPCTPHGLLSVLVWSVSTHIYVDMLVEANVQLLREALAQ
jgi:hypothetical protein